ncbi:MAG TPA: hypothetical protein VF727_01815 [Allosphingosinicella sp.]|jgi:hypothetical protein
MAKRTPLKALYGDYGFREPAMGKSPNQIRRELGGWSRAAIDRSIRAGVALFQPNWPWARAPSPGEAQQ